MGVRKKQSIVVIGGGTGSYTVLRGLKNYPVDLSAVVSMMDSGGSSGKLRDEFGYLPQGDVRRCLIALSEDSSMLRRVFEYRFQKGGLQGHSLGNLFLAALREITGTDEDAIEEASKLLKIRGNILPATLKNAHIGAILENGQVVVSETNIDIPKHDSHLRIKKLFLIPKVKANKKAVAAILNADKVIIGPGDLYTSILPNILLADIKKALAKTKAKKIYVCNIMTKFGETTNFKVNDFVSEIEKYLGKDILDVVLLNSKKPDSKVLAPYLKEGSGFVKPDYSSKKYAVVKTDLLFNTQIARHDPDKLAKAILKT